MFDDNATFIGEKTALTSNNSVRGFDVVDDLKAKFKVSTQLMIRLSKGGCSLGKEERVAGFGIRKLDLPNAMTTLGGPSWKVKRGRRDFTTASKAAANNFIPGPNFYIIALLSSFAAQGLSLQDLAQRDVDRKIKGKPYDQSFSLIDHVQTLLARQGAQRFKHTSTMTLNIGPSFAKSLQLKCPKRGKDDWPQTLDFQTPTRFDNLYFHNLLKMKGLIRSDQGFFIGTSVDSLVTKKFWRDKDQLRKTHLKLPTVNINITRGSLDCEGTSGFQQKPQ
ncbi:cationic peroxidase 1-like [Durio zibethinus]|uniref:peroxidase n=1 Tax=Durio zibethinus TaxID=66656 RepID=A0A6P5Z696_DURZI|nr:cationic peroxidase 1-like [Durio zibethinus]